MASDPTLALELMALLVVLVGHHKDGRPIYRLPDLRAALWRVVPLREAMLHCEATNDA